MGLRRARKNPLAIIGVTILTFEILVAIFATQLAPYDPYEPDYGNVKQQPSAEHLIRHRRPGARCLQPRDLWQPRLFAHRDCSW